MPPQNLVDRTIVGVAALRVKLAYPDAALAVRPARHGQMEPEAAARASRPLNGTIHIGVTDDLFVITALPPPSAPDAETLSLFLECDELGCEGVVE